MQVTHKPPPVDYVCGLDLGQAADYSALAIVEVGESPETLSTTSDDTGGETIYAVRHLHRWPLGTSYRNIAADVAELVTRRELDSPRLAIDATGCGRPVVEMIMSALGDVDGGDLVECKPIIITSGAGASYSANDRCFHVAKLLLVSALQACLSSSRLKIAPELPLAPVLVNELKTFKTRITPAGHEVFGNWRERDHDDLVLAVALALWLADRTGRPCRVSPDASGGRGWSSEPNLLDILPW